jgi:hypothetical protein
MKAKLINLIAKRSVVAALIIAVISLVAIAVGFSWHDDTKLASHKTEQTKHQSVKPKNQPIAAQQSAPAAASPASTTASTPKSVLPSTGSTISQQSKTSAPVVDNSPYGPRCGNLLSQYYTANYNGLNAARAEHQAALAELEQHYNNGDYDDPDNPDPAQAYDDYMADVTDENDYWQQLSLEIPQGYNDKLRTAGCGYTV